MKKYSVEEFTADITVDEYIEQFRNEDRFMELCKMCPNYGNSWGCPPFGFDTEKFLRKYRHARLTATKITPVEKNIAIGRAQELILPERIRIEKTLLDMERDTGGRAFAYIGKCLYCPDSECRRKFGQPCIHPDKVRPSLEAFGFDIEKTLSELFNITILWCDDGVLPEYLVLVTALFHNQTKIGAAASGE